MIKHSDVKNFEMGPFQHLINMDLTNIVDDAEIVIHKKMLFLA